MANSDVIITRSGRYQPAIASEHVRRVVRVLAKYLTSGLSSGSAPTASQQNSLLSQTRIAFNGVPNGMLESAACGIWMEGAITAIGSGIAVDGTSLNTLLASAKVLLAADDDTLTRLELLLEGKVIGVLTVS